MIIQATDAKTASDKFIQIKNLITLAGGQAGITSTDETYNGTTITLVDVSSLAQLAAGAAGSGRQREPSGASATSRSPSPRRTIS